MSLLTKLTVGAVAVLGAYALKAKRSDATDHARPPPRRARKAKPAGRATAAKPGRSVERAAKPAAAGSSTRKRPARRSSAKRARTA
jgi:hypothetical protein